MVDNNIPLKVEKPWGYELIYAHTEAYVGKLLFVKKGHRLSLHLHNIKDETFYCHDGSAIAEVEDGDGEMVITEILPGSSYRVLPGKKHRLQAVEDTVVFEVSTPHLDDVVRLDDDFGRA